MQSRTVSSRVGPISSHRHPRPHRDLPAFEELNASGLKGLADSFLVLQVQGFCAAALEGAQRVM